jgi:acyl-CoA synthetase (AMP-forming)/AMP-acid ligase II
MTFDPMAELEKPFGDYSALITAWARLRPARIAIDDGHGKLTWSETAALVERIAAQLQADGLQKGQAVAILGTSTIGYALAYLGAIRAGGCAAPLTTSATPAQLEAMLKDSGAMHLFIDGAKFSDLKGRDLAADKIVMLDAPLDGLPDMFQWMAPEGSEAAPHGCGPKDPFNIIYSSGTTGTPKGIVHSRQMRWLHATVGTNTGYGEADAASFAATPLYSNTTLAIVIPTLAYGGTLHIMPKFDVTGYLERAQAERITHTMLVPVQYKRLMEYERFDEYDLSSYRLKYCTSAPFAPALKADVLKRWPGGLVEIYSMTEGGVVCLLLAHEHPDKLHTVGIPWKGSEVFTIDEAGNRLPAGETGELVGRSATMMSGYQNQPDKTREGYWIDPDDSSIWQRMGDIGRVDADGFVELLGRSKDMIISGGFNIYPVDLEGVLLGLPGVEEAAVIGMPSEKWGETPVGFVTGAKGVRLDTAAILNAANDQLGKTQRLSALYQIDEMPRSHIGKLLKTDLRAIAEQMEAV